MPRGGYQKPSNPAPVSGPGRFSRRTDGQRIQGPDLDNPDVQYGDRQMIEDAQRTQKMRGAAGARVPSRSMGGTPPTRGKLPPWLTQTPDTNPDQPTQAGLGMGPGPGPEILDAGQPTDDVREVVMEFIASTYGNKDAADWLAQFRQERANSAMAQPVSDMAEEALGPAAGIQAEATLPGV